MQKPKETNKKKLGMPRNKTSQVKTIICSKQKKVKHVNRKIFLKTHTNSQQRKLWLFQTTQKTNEAKRTNLAHRLTPTHTQFHSLTQPWNHGSNWFNFKFLPFPISTQPRRIQLTDANKQRTTLNSVLPRRSKRSFQRQLQVDTKWKKLNLSTLRRRRQRRQRRRW